MIRRKLQLSFNYCFSSLSFSPSFRYLTIQDVFPFFISASFVLDYSNAYTPDGTEVNASVF